MAEHLTVDLARRLLAEQYPQWAHLPIRPVDLDGWDNTTFRLGDDKLVRLPSGPGYAAQVDKAHEWLPKLAPLLPLPIPEPLAKGAPSPTFPLPWSVYRWIEGAVAGGAEHAIGRPSAPIDDMAEFAAQLGRFLTALQAISPEDGPQPGRHNGFRGGPLTTWCAPSPLEDCVTSDAIEALRGRIDADAATEVWKAALDAPWESAPVWVHGDVSPTNLLVANGKLHAVIDFGCSAVGDPACDFAIAWTFFTAGSRDAFRRAMSLDASTWARGRGWALWKAAIVLARDVDHDPERALAARRVLDEVLADHAAEA